MADRYVKIRIQRAEEGGWTIYGGINTTAFCGYEIAAFRSWRALSAFVNKMEAAGWPVGEPRHD